MSSQIFLQASACLFCVFIGPTLSMAVPQNTMADPGLDSIEKRGIAGNDCGTIAVYTILRSYGYHPDYDAICADITPGIYGNTLAQLSGYLENNASGLDFSVGCINAHRLRDLLREGADRKAIINMNDHWVVVDDLVGESLKVVDFPKKYHLPCAALDELWDGYAIVVSRKGISLIHSFGVCLATVSLAGMVVFACKRVRRCGPGPQLPT